MPAQHIVFSTHLDDDIIFMNNDIYDAIARGEAVTSVYLVTGDRVREAGIKAAYAVMADADDWVDETVTIDGNQIASSYLASAPDVRLYFLRFPDQGSGNAISAQLWDEVINTATTEDGVTYSRDSLVDMLTAIMTVHQPDNILTHARESAVLGGDHGEHAHYAEFVWAARENYTTSHDVDEYVGYGVAGLPVNVTDEDLARKTEVFEAYGAFDTNALNIPVFRDWLQRQYYVGPDGTPVADDWDIRDTLPMPDASVSGRYFIDENANGLEDVGEAGVAGANVYLYDDTTYRVVATTITDADGLYQFADVDPAPRYAVFFERPQDIASLSGSYAFTNGNSGDDDRIDSDVRSRIADGRGEVDRFALAAHEAVTDVDAGLVQTAPPPPPPPPVEDGTFAAQYFDVGSVSSLDQINFAATPVHSEQVAYIQYANSRGSFWAGGEVDTFAARITGTVDVPEQGSYTFYLRSDDGSQLSINGQVVIGNDGLHGLREQSATLDLDAGQATIEVLYFENRGHAGLELDWAGPGLSGRTAVTASDGDAPPPPPPPVNPDAMNDTFIITDDTWNVAGNVLDNDTGDGLELVDAFHGFINGSYVALFANGDIRLSQRGQFDDLAPGESRTISLDYTIQDANGSRDTATIDLVITDDFGFV
ncbi:SdrD B-like domain-containing protein [Yoonia sp. SS1-5]|uniref:SdrD B-like domain-containing protein n=1 Tax=Yoonia rhodophyticola TaxID=3137370 RepID=A0AAN0MGG5_9RHOB